MDDGSLRAKAEKLLQRKPKADTSARPVEELVHELQVHQIELEMQNEELRRAHVSMEEARDRYVDLYEFAPLGYITINREAEIVEINLAAAALLGADRSKIVNRRFSTFVSDRDKDRWHRLFSNMMEHGEAKKHACDLEMTGAGGSTFFAHLDCLRRKPLDAPPVLRIALADISKLKQAEAELRIAAAAFESQEGFLVTDAKGVILRGNQAFASMTGYTPDEVTGRPARFLLSGSDNAVSRTTMEECIGNTGAWEGEIDIDHKNGEAFPIRLAIAAVKGPDGTVTNYVGALTDITKRRGAEEDLRRYRGQLEETVERRTAELVLARDAAEAANKAKSAFLANVSHELRTPLNAILGFSAMLRGEPDLTGSQRENLDIINRSGEHLLRLINDVLEIAKIEAGRTQVAIAPFDPGAMVRDVADMMRLRAQGKGLQLLLDLPSEFPRYIKGDEARLRQVLVNLTGNAVKFTEHGGVTIRLGVKYNRGDRLLMEVEDTGPGIEPEDRERLFNPFVQVAEAGAQQGSGLGLTISRQFVELMGGTIGVESTVGKGSVFRVEVPVELAEAGGTGDRQRSAEPGEVAGPAPGTPRYRVLIAEDQADNRVLLTQLMEKIGLDVKVAGNGVECVKLFQEWHPHLIWMDRRMPVMDGMEATRRIRELPQGRDVKIVAATASVFKEQQHEMLDAAMDDFVPKPYRFHEVYASLAKQLGITYVYRASPAAREAAPVLLTPAMLVALPAATRNEFRDALESLDSERIHALIQHIGEADAELGRTLSCLAEKFDYPVILNALALE